MANTSIFLLDKYHSYTDTTNQFYFASIDHFLRNFHLIFHFLTFFLLMNYEQVWLVLQVFLLPLQINLYQNLLVFYLHLWKVWFHPLKVYSHQQMAYLGQLKVCFRQQMAYPHLLVVHLQVDFYPYRDLQADLNLHHLQYYLSSL